jgi:hypothetical protein
VWQAVEILWPATARVRLPQVPRRACAGYRRHLRRRLAASPTLLVGFLQRILSGAPSCVSVSPQHQQQCISKSVVDCCIASTVAC